MGTAKKRLKDLQTPLRIFSKNIAMEFGINKCAHVTMKAGKLVVVVGMELLSGKVILELVIPFKSYPSKSKCAIPTWKEAVQKDQSPSLH